MTKIKNAKGRRVLTLGVVLLTLIAIIVSLSSCSGTSSKFEYDETKETEHEFIARVILQNPSYTNRFVAAFRGYDITSDDHVEPDSPDVVKVADIDAGKKLITQIYETGKFKNELSKEVFAEYKDTLTEYDMTLIVDELAKKYEVDAKNGFPDIILVWIGKALGALTRLVGDYYVLAIIIFALLVEILMLPISIKQQKNSIGMAQLRPKIAKIEKKYAGRTDQATMKKKQEEIMELQQREGFSPFSGCLPLILQLIIVGFVLYPIIQNPLRYMLDTSVGFSEALLAFATSPKSVGGLGIQLTSARNIIELLTVFDKENIQLITQFPLIESATADACLTKFMSLDIPKFTAFGINLGKVPTLGFNILMLVPIVNVAGQFLSMHLTKKWSGNAQLQPQGQDAQSNASMKMMELVGPLMTLFIMFQVPAMIGVYWFIRSLFSLGKQFIIKTVLPIPKYTEEELRDMEKAEKERQRAQKEALKEQPKFKSLHYIDADDYDELPEVKDTGKSKKKADPTERPEIKD